MNYSPEPHRLPVIRNRYFFVADLLLVALAASISFLLRLEWGGLAPYRDTLLAFAGLAVLVKPVVFFLFGLYRRHWHYASVSELANIALATFTATAAVTLLLYSLVSLVFTFRALPRSIPIIDWLVSLALVGGSRFAVRLGTDRRLWGQWLIHRGRAGFNARRQRSALVMGAGDAGAMIVREMQANPGLGFVPVGLLDDNRAKCGMLIHGVPVLGTRDDISHLVRDTQVDEVIIAMPSAPGQAIREVVRICQEAGVACRTLPGIYELISGQVSVRQVREVRIEDLLRREPVRIEGARSGDRVQQGLANRVVLVTGAGGSIGAELCRQIALSRPKQLLLLGHGETSIHRILAELREKQPHAAVQPVVADVRDLDRLREILVRFQPEIIFHAAAHKHVPLMEMNVAEAVTNNVFGTRSLLQAAETSSVQRFVLVSSDKAVNPASIMGASKRAAELMVQDAARRTGRAYVAVRFGNVLGSRGSVVPLFQRQIAAGGPVTVTHPEMRRYFMTIPEAAQLIVQAAVLGQGGEVFVLDMGEPIRVLDLATDLIRLSGLTPERDIKIVFTGSRPGEKLSESLFADGEEPHSTHHEKILVAKGNNTWDSATLSRHLDELEALSKSGDPARIHAKMQEIVPEYRPVSSLSPAPSTPLPVGEGSE